MNRKQLGPLTYKFEKGFLKNKGLNYGPKTEGAWNNYGIPEICLVRNILSTKTCLD